MTLKELLTTTHAGTVCAVDEARGLCFARNRRIHDLTGWDVRFHLQHPPHTLKSYDGDYSDRPKVIVGDLFTFEVDLDSSGRPWVRMPQGVATQGGNVSVPSTNGRREPPAGHGTFAGRPLTVETLLKSEHVGVVAEYVEDMGYGFIRNSQIHRLCGRDVRFQAWQLPDHKVGDEVKFRIKLNSDGLPRVAESVSTAGEPLPRKTRHAPSSRLGVSTIPVGGLFQGVVVEVNTLQGFGLVACDEVRLLGFALGQALLTRRSLPGLREGDQVSFRIEASELSGGQRGMRPRAVDVTAFAGQSNPSVERAVSPPRQSRFPCRWSASGVEGRRTWKPGSGWRPPADHTGTTTTIASSEAWCHSENGV